VSEGTVWVVGMDEIFQRKYVLVILDEDGGVEVDGGELPVEVVSHLLMLAPYVWLDSLYASSDEDAEFG